MPIRIDTTHADYVKGLRRFRGLRAAMRPRIKRYFKMSPEQQARWLEKDVMMREFIHMCERVAVKNNDD